MAAPDGSGNRGLYLYDLEAGTLQPIIEATLGADLFGARWSPDGEQIVYSAYDPSVETISAKTYVAASDGSGARAIDPGPGFDNAVSPVSNDGSRVVIARLDGDALPTGNLITSLAGDGTAIAIGCAGPGQPSCPEDWIWSPDDTVLIGAVDDDRFVVADPTTGVATLATFEGHGAPSWQRLPAAAD
jgi:Tol biopolymer transport system component